MFVGVNLVGDQDVLKAAEELRAYVKNKKNNMPANIEIDENYIRNQLARRQKGHGRGKRMKIEKDYAEIYSGVRLGHTIGAPIGLIINNADYKNWVKKMSITSTDELIKKITAVSLVKQTTRGTGRLELNVRTCQ